MKKHILLLAFCLLLCALFSVNAAGGAKGKLSLTGEAEHIKHGDTLELSVQLSRNPGVKTLRCTVDFDPAVLTFVSAEGTDTLTDFSCQSAEDHITLSWGSETDLADTGVLAKIFLKVREDAIYGDSAVSLSVSETKKDAKNSLGLAVPFDTTGIKFSLICAHENTTKTTEKEATFEEAGLIKEACPACGNTTMHPVYPTIKSCDGRVLLTVPAGEFKNDDRVEIFADDLYGTEEAPAVRELLGKDLLYAFRIRVTKNGEKYVPIKDCTVTLISDFPLPEDLILYGLMDQGAAQPKLTQGKNTLEFAYNDVIFALVARPAPAEPALPSVTVAPKTTPAPTTKNNTENQRREDLILIVSGGGVLLLCGVGMILILGKRKRF